MKFSSLLIALFLSSATNPEAAISYFHYVREVTISRPTEQNYFVVDTDIWERARPDLADLRLLDGADQVPYALREKRGRRSQEEQEAKILNLGTVAGQTQFVLDVGEIPEYDRVKLRLEAKNFVAVAKVAGEVELNRGPLAQLGSTTLYDFSREGLGSNVVLQLPTSNFRYLHVTLGPGIRPEDVKGATISNLQETKTSWTAVGTKPEITQEGKSTIVRWDTPPHVPLDRVIFRVAPRDVNFRRSVTLKTIGAKPGEEIFRAGGSISRVRVTRGANAVNSESLELDVPSTRAGKYILTIENGDDRPLDLEAVQPQSVERRVYFDPQGKSSLRLYYGDEKLTAPVYDYDKFFRDDTAAALAQLGPGAANPQYAARPDVRPWTEQHQGVMWAAMVVAIAGLALVAVRGMKKV